MNRSRVTAALQSNPLRWLVGLTLWAMLASQWVAQLHEVAHCDSASTGVVAFKTNATSTESSTSWGRHALEVGAAHDPGSALCQLIHQLAHASVAPALAVIAFEPPALPAPIATLADGRPAAAAGDYRARAPPSLA